jgi:hypothetical protein
VPEPFVLVFIQCFWDSKKSGSVAQKSTKSGKSSRSGKSRASSRSKSTIKSKSDKDQSLVDSQGEDESEADTVRNILHICFDLPSQC